MTATNSIPFYKKLASCFFPITIEKSSQPYYLELLLSKNKLILNSKNANQSNENLERAFHLLFHELGLYKKHFENVLILGYGLGSVAHLLTKNGSVKAITAYENDKRILDYIEIYQLDKAVNLKSISAEKIIERKTSFDLIIVDLFIDNQSPNFLNTLPYWQDLKSLLTPRGILIWNTLLSHPPKADFQIEKLFDKKVEIMGLNRMWIVEG